MVHARGFGLIVAVLAMVALVGLPGVVMAQQPDNTNITTIAAARTFSCGAGNTFTKFGVANGGSLLQFESPAGKEHILIAFLGSGFAVCHSAGGAAFSTSQDFGGGANSGWLDGNVCPSASCIISQPNGASTFPLEITRTTVDGQLTVTRRITGNSFVLAPAGAYDGGDADAVGCSSLSECGNCTNRTAHVLTRLKNNTGLVMTVRVVEASDFDISGSTGNDRGAKTADSGMVWEDLDDPGAAADSRGMLMQALILAPVQVSVPVVGTVTGGVAAGCILPAGLATPTGPMDPEVAIRNDVTLGPGATDGSNVRTHYRRF